MFQKILFHFPWGYGLSPRLMHSSLGPTKSTTQTASQFPYSVSVIYSMPITKWT